MNGHKESHNKIMADMGKLFRNCPGVGDGFGKLHQEALKGGALSTKDKELIALGIAVAIRCAGCITCHAKAAVDAGATREEIYEAVSVAVMMSGGPGVVYGSIAVEAMEEFLAK